MWLWPGGLESESLIRDGQDLLSWKSNQGSSRFLELMGTAGSATLPLIIHHATLPLIIHHTALHTQKGTIFHHRCQDHQPPSPDPPSAPSLNTPTFSPPQRLQSCLYCFNRSLDLSKTSIVLEALF